MPIPLIIWGAAAGIAWLNRKKIVEVVTSEKFIDGASKAAEGFFKPYEEILNKIYPMDSDSRKAYLRQEKGPMTPFVWGSLVSHTKVSAQKDPRYFPVYMDVAAIEKEN
jgi:hypothetical protein